MKKENTLKLFEDKKVRAVWDSQKEKWWFSVVDVVEVLTGSERPRKYWGDLKKKLIDEGSELSEKIGQLKMVAPDGKFYMTDVLDTEGVLGLYNLSHPLKQSHLKFGLQKSVVTV